MRNDIDTATTTSGPPLAVPVLAYATLTVAAVVTNARTPHPDASGADVLNYVHDHNSLIKIGSWLLFLSAIPLTVAAATAYRRLRGLGVTAAGSAIALLGGACAALGLALSGLASWTMGRLPATADPDLARAVADLSFATGGPAFAVMFALLIAGIAVPSLLAHLLPRPMSWIGLALAAIGAISTLTLLNLDFGFLLPIVRFGGLIWLIVAAFLLRSGRPAPIRQ